MSDNSYYMRRKYPKKYLKMQSKNPFGNKIGAFKSTNNYYKRKIYYNKKANEEQETHSFPPPEEIPLSRLSKRNINELSNVEDEDFLN